jgi:hypothetical protein
MALEHIEDDTPFDKFVDQEVYLTELSLESNPDRGYAGSLKGAQRLLARGFNRLIDKYIYWQICRELKDIE